MKARSLIALFLGLVVGYLVLLIYPTPLFAFDKQYKSFEVFSDRPIPNEITTVIDDAIQRLELSELYTSNEKFKLFLCNENWRFKFFTRNGGAGGVVNFFISPNIFIRENIIEQNKLIPPVTWKNSMTDRPLSYFIAHEATHSLQRKYDQYLIINVPVEIVEGYAEYVGKSTTNDFEYLKEQYVSNSPTMDPKNGLYDKYRLYMLYLIERKGYNFKRVIQEQPDIEKTLKEILSE